MGDVDAGAGGGALVVEERFGSIVVAEAGRGLVCQTERRASRNEGERSSVCSTRETGLCV